MASNSASDEEITPEINDKTESPSITKEENNTGNSDSLFHLLEGRWTFWYTHRPTTFRNSAVNYDSCLKKLGVFSFNLLNRLKNFFLYRYIWFN